MNFVVTYREKDGSRNKIAIEAADRAGVFPILRERGISAIRVEEGELPAKKGRSKWSIPNGLKLLLVGFALLSLVAVALTFVFNRPNGAKVSQTTTEEPELPPSIEKASPVCEKLQSNCPSDWMTGPDASWKVFWNDALADAKASGKKIFVLSTGSDWCGWCKKLKQDVFEKDEFKNYAQKKLVLLYLDSPRKPLPEGQKQHNDTVRGTLSFGGGVPCAAVFGVDSRRYGVISGYSETPAKYIARIDEVLAKKGEMPKSGQPPKIFTEGYSEPVRVDSGEKMSDAKNQEDLKNLSAEVLPKKLDDAQNENLASSAAPTNVVKWTYEIVNGGVVLGGYGRLAVPKNTFGGLVIPEKIDGNPVCGIGWRAFYGCSGLKSVTIPSSVTNIGNCAFYGCNGLTSVTIPPSVTSIEGWVFGHCKELKSVAIPSSVTSIGFRAFEGCTMLASVTVPSSVKSIGSGAFEGCSGLVSVTIPSSVTSVGMYAFKGCSGLKSVTIPGLNCEIEYANVTNLVISDGTVEIQKHFCSFRNCGKIKSVKIPSSVTSIGMCAFEGCSGLVEFYVSSDHTKYSSINSLLLTKNGDSVVRGVNGDVTIPSCVTSIGQESFRGCAGLTSVAIPSSVTSIGNAAFRDCRGLASVMIPSSVTSIGAFAFYGCSGLTSVTIPSSVTSIGSGAFKGCRGLTKLTIPSSVTNIGWYAFEDCSGLTSLSILPGVTSIGWNMFCGCSNLTSVTIPSTVTNIIDGAFNNCGRLRSVTIPSSVTRISEIAFWGCSRLHEFVVSPDNPNYSSINGLLLSKRGDSLIQCVSGDMSIPSSVTNIADWAFMSCIDSMFKFSVSEENPKYSSVNGLLLTKKGDLLVQGVNGDVTIPPCVTSIGEGAFQYCDGLRSVMIPPSVTIIEGSAFDGCRGLTSVTIPSSVRSIGKKAFSGCRRLETIYVDEGDEDRVKSMILSSGASVDKLKFVKKDVAKSK